MFHVKQSRMPELNRQTHSAYEGHTPCLFPVPGWSFLSSRWPAATSRFPGYSITTTQQSFPQLKYSTLLCFFLHKNAQKRARYLRARLCLCCSDFSSLLVFSGSYVWYRILPFLSSSPFSKILKSYSGRALWIFSPSSEISPS